jgi:glucosylceramidase
LPGAYRVGVTKRDEQVEAAAFLNRDGSRIAILHRKSGDAPLTIALDGTRYSLALPSNSVATVWWK